MNRRKLLLSLVGAPIGIVAVATASAKRAKPAPTVTFAPNKVLKVSKARATHDHNTDALQYVIYDDKTGKILAENI